MSQRGLLVVVSGRDGVGKSTLVSRFENQEGVTVMRFPDRTAPNTGEALDRVLRLKNPDKKTPAEVLQLMSDNRWERADWIEQLLASGLTVVCDRYATDGVAYHMAKGYGMEAAKEPDIGLPAPDLVFWIRSHALSRVKGEEIFETQEMQDGVERAFGELSTTDDGLKWIALFNEPPNGDVTYNAIVEHMDAIRADRGPIKKLWQ